MESVENIRPAHKLAIGQFSMEFQPAFTMLRNVCWDGHEVLRAIYVAVRDTNWNTVLPSVSNVRIDSDRDTLRLSFEAFCQQSDIRFKWLGAIEIKSGGSLTFNMRGMALSSFRKNRLGFCILHPAECAGQECEIEHADGSIERSTFPKWISPHQPFKSMLAISHRVAPRLSASVRMEGDVFEMEDQRNWTDASFKTYCTPLEVPFPVAVNKGTALSQSVTLAIEDSRQTGSPRTHQGSSTAVKIFVGDHNVAHLPPLGLAVASHRLELTGAEGILLRSLQLGHLRVELHLASEDWFKQLQQAEAQAAVLGTYLELALFVTDQCESQLVRLTVLLGALCVPVARMFVFHDQEKATTRESLELVHRHFRNSENDASKCTWSSLDIGAGTNIYFTELNRLRPPIDLSDCVVYSINPQVHAFDDDSLVETLAMQGFTVQSAQQFCGTLPIYISPVTLRPRFNPNATVPAPESPTEELPPQVDPRQSSLFAAAWTLGSLKYLSEAGVAGITYYETTGLRGVIDAEHLDRPRQLFSSVPGGVYPLYHVLRDVAHWTGAEIVNCSSTNPLQVVGLALRKPKQLRILFANLTSAAQSVSLALALPKQRAAKRISLRKLFRGNLKEAVTHPEQYRTTASQQIDVVEDHLAVDLPAHAYCCIDWHYAPYTVRGPD